MKIVSLVAVSRRGEWNYTHNADHRGPHELEEVSWRVVVEGQDCVLRRGFRPIHDESTRYEVGLVTW